VYAGPQPILDGERDTYAAYLESFADSPAAEPEPDPAPGEVQVKPVQPAVAQVFARGGEEI
jgi:hypothetical protein